METISWKWNQFWKRTIPGSIGGLIFGLLVFGIATMSSEFSKLISEQSSKPLLVLISALISGLIFGLVSGLVGGFTARVMVDKASPNQGIKLSRKNSFAVFLVAWLTVGVIPGVIAGLRSGQIGNLSGWLIVGLIVGLNRGGSAVIKHYALRLTLWRRYAPLKFVKFLDHCARLIFLKKVGGGYIFIHRMLLEYFAELTPQSKRLEVGSKASK